MQCDKFVPGSVDGIQSQFMMSFCRFRTGKLLLCVLFAIILWTFIHRAHWSKKKANYNVMVWWSPYEKQFDYHRKCGQIECRFTSDRTVAADGYLFYGKSMSIQDMPTARRLGEYWGLYHDDSPKNIPFLLNGLNLFNVSSTISRHSTIPLTFQSFTSLEQLINYKTMYTFGQKTSFQRKMKIAPVLYMQSHCDTLTGRELYVKELGKYVAIDSYGSCLKNKTLPNDITYDLDNKNAMRDYNDFISKYKFIIVYQDINCEDYIVEEFWKSLSLGIVPIYFGATNIRSYLPNPNSAILIDDYSSPQNLAQFILQASNNEEVYANFLYHKTSNFYPISNQLLVNAIFKEDIYYIEDRKRRTLVELECHVCEQSFQHHNQQAQQKELSCVLPHFPPGNITYKAVSRINTFIEQSLKEAELVRKIRHRYPINIYDNK